MEFDFLAQKNWARAGNVSFQISLRWPIFTLSTHLIKPNYLVVLPPTQHHSFFRNLPSLAGIVEWNGSLRLFRFYGILGQPREVHPKLRNEIPENVSSIRSKNIINSLMHGTSARGVAL